MDFARKSVTLDSRRLVLTRKEYELLSLLVENAGEIIPREVLLMRVWGYSNQIRTRTLDVHVRRLRIRLGSYSGQYLETIFGIGYRFQPLRAEIELLKRRAFNCAFQRCFPSTHSGTQQKAPGMFAALLTLTITKKERNGRNAPRKWSPTKAILRILEVSFR